MLHSFSIALAQMLALVQGGYKMQLEMDNQCQRGEMLLKNLVGVFWGRIRDQTQGFQGHFRVPQLPSTE